MARERQIGLSRTDPNVRPLLRKHKSLDQSQILDHSGNSTNQSLPVFRKTSEKLDDMDEDIYAPPKDSDDEEETEQVKLPEVAAGTTSQTGKLPVNLGRQARASKPKTDNLEEEPYALLKEQQPSSTSSSAHDGSSQSSSVHSRGRGKVTRTGPTNTAGLKLGEAMGWEAQSSQKAKRARTTYGSSQPKHKDQSPTSKFKHPPPPVASPGSPNSKFKIPNIPSSPLSEREDAPEFKRPTLVTLPDNRSASSQEEPQFRKPTVDISLNAENAEYALHDEEPILSSQINDADNHIDSSPEPLFKSWNEPAQVEKSHTHASIFRINSMVEKIMKDGSIDLADGLDQFMQSTHPTSAIEGSTGSLQTEGNEHEIYISSSPGKADAKCPMCGEVVDANFLKTFHDGKHMNTRTQAKFCQAHKRRAAKDSWASRSYPVIQWDELDARVEQHYKLVTSILNGAPSYYRNVLDEIVRSGKNRTLRQTIMSSESMPTPGYYGSRGLRIMSENIMREFAPQLRRIAVKDKLMSARGVSGYVQSVLVPEVAVMLIQEDMDVNVEEARSIMRDSVAMGDLVNEEIEDIVTRRSGDEHELTQWE